MHLTVQLDKNDANSSFRQCRHPQIELCRVSTPLDKIFHFARFLSSLQYALGIEQIVLGFRYRLKFVFCKTILLYLRWPNLLTCTWVTGTVGIRSDTTNISSDQLPMYPFWSGLLCVIMHTLSTIIKFQFHRFFWMGYSRARIASSLTGVTFAGAIPIDRWRLWLYAYIRSGRMSTYLRVFRHKIAIHFSFKVLLNLSATAAFMSSFSLV